jgi:serine/threonine protein kinase
MFNRFIIHIQNLFNAIGWIVGNYNEFQEHLDNKGYYSISFYKIWLWKKNARYFKVYNAAGKCFFLKMKTKDSINQENEILKYISLRDSNNIRFYPKLIESNTSIFNYSIYENIEALRIRKKYFGIFFLNQINQILVFLKNNQIIHRDIRPHNILVTKDKIFLLDFEHCVVKGKSFGDDIMLNRHYSPGLNVWDDAFSFKRIVEKYCSEDFKTDSVYNQICSLVGEYEFHKSL